MNGVELDPLRICHEVHFPVPKGTPMISPLINWDHSASWNVATFNDFPSGPLSGKSGVTYEIDMSENSPDNYLRGHVIDGRVLFPASGYIVLAWKTFAKIKGKNYQAMPVKFENVNIKRATMLPSEGLSYCSYVSFRLSSEKYSVKKLYIFLFIDLQRKKVS